MVSEQSAHRQRRGAIAAALATPIAALLTASVLAPPAGARALGHAGGARSSHHARAARATVHLRAYDLDGRAAIPSIGVYALDWKPGQIYRARWAHLVGAFLQEIGTEGVSAANHHAGAKGRAATVTQTVSTTSTAAASSTSAPTSTSTLTSTTSSTTSAAAGGPPHAPAKPVLSARALPSSLSHALKKGVSVHYSVDQQVAGYFELLMPSRVARRLHVKAQRSRWLRGSGHGQTLIAYRLLVTTRGAHGRIKITIPRAAAGRLRRLHHLTLTLRVTARSAARRRPKTARLQSTITLKRAAAIHAIHASPRKHG